MKRRVDGGRSGKSRGSVPAGSGAAGDDRVRVGSAEVKATDKYETPQEFFDYWDSLFNFSLDVCAEHSTAKCDEYWGKDETNRFIDGLTIEWSGRCFCNPPYSKPLPWIEKAKAEQARGVFTCMLLPGDISPKWYLALNSPGVVKVPLTGRLGFLLNGEKMDGSKFGNIIALFFPLTGEGARLP